MSTRKALQSSLRVVEDTLETIIATQRQQLQDALVIADNARAKEDWETWAAQARNVADLTKALDETLEMRTQSRATVPEASTAALVAELTKRARAGEKDAAAALKPSKAR